MKRINPNTGVPFKRGDIQENGLRFSSYSKKLKRKDGTFYEYWSKNVKENRKTISNLQRIKAQKMLCKAKERAVKKDFEFSLTLDWLVNKIDNGFCELTKMPFTLDKTNSLHNPFGPSLDRINNKKGYTVENVRVVLWCVNRSLGEDGLEVMKPIFRILASL
jgi:hypothetical protein